MRLSVTDSIIRYISFCDNCDMYVRPNYLFFSSAVPADLSFVKGWLGWQNDWSDAYLCAANLSMFQFSCMQLLVSIHLQYCYVEG